MKLLVDALSVNNLSGAYVLRGHLMEILKAGLPEDRLYLLTHRRNTHVADGLSQTGSAMQVEHLIAPIAGTWWSRARWYHLRVSALCKAKGIDCVFSPSGYLTPACDLPQWVLAQNPWPLVDRSRGLSGLRSRLQAAAFRKAHHQAKVMVFNSLFMRDLYERSFGTRRGERVLAYQGLTDEQLDASRVLLGVEQRASSILAVSVMARHKGIEVLIDAYAQLLDRFPAAQLKIAGSWPDQGYRKDIEAQIARLGLGARVELLGHVSEQALQDLYRSSRVFCLLSRCESFGIPALEAQAYGTPCVVADGTAAPEVIGAGGLVVAQDDPASTARALGQLLSDDAHWSTLSSLALDNVQRFRWSQCSQALLASLRGMRAGSVAASPDMPRP